MRNILLSPLTAALLLAGQAGFAQETSSDSTDDAGTEFNIGEQVPSDVGQPYIREEFGDWALRCIRAPEGQADPCNLYQLLLNAEGVAVAEFNMFQLPPGGQAVAGANVVVPLETLLTQQLTIAVDGANSRRYPFTFCNRAGCVARLGFTQAEVDQFKAGAKATVRIVPAAAPDTEVVLDVSLSGFTAGYDSTAETSGN